MKRSICILAFSTLLLPGSSFAASKEQQEMQRDIAQLQDQVRMLQSGFDQAMARVQTLLEQSLDAGNKANTNVSVLSSSVRETLDRDLKDALRPIAGLTAKVDNLGNDSSDTKNQLAELTARMNQVIQKLNDLDNAIKVLQTPPAPPPAQNQNPDAQTRVVAPPRASDLWASANNDYAALRSDLAASEFAQFVSLYPEDPYASKAQIFIGQIHLGQMKYEQAVMDFDAVLERYPESKDTVDAYFLKGMSLKALGRFDAAGQQFKTIVRKYPNSDRAPEAKAQLKALGLTAGPTKTTKR